VSDKDNSVQRKLHGKRGVGVEEGWEGVVSVSVCMCVFIYL